MKTKHDNVNNEFPADTLIYCASYEERTICTFNKLMPKYKPKKIIQFIMKEFENLKEVQQNLKKINKIIKSNNCEKTELKCYWDEPIKNINKIYEKLINEIDTNLVTIDCTTFPRNVLLPLLKLIHYKEKKQIRLLYWSPKIYGTEIGEWLTKGIDRIEPLPMFGGTPISGKEKILITFLGFENERAFKIWEVYEPVKTILVIGHPPVEKHWENVSYYINQKLVTQNNVEIKYTSAKDHINVFNFLTKFYSTLNHEKYDLIIAPLGTKLQLLGVYLFTLNNPDVQIAYAYPKEYNIKNYSKGCRKKYEKKI